MSRVWLNRLPGDLFNDPDKVVLDIHNNSAISLCKNQVYHDRSKLIDTRYYYIKDCVEEDKVDVEYVSTENQHADILTKPLGRINFLEIRKSTALRVMKKPP